MSSHETHQSSALGLMVEQAIGNQLPVDIKLPSRVIKAGQTFAKTRLQKKLDAPSVDSADLAHKLVPRNRMNTCFGFNWSSVTYWRKEQEGSFVPPIRIGRQVYYRYGAVIEWIAAQEAAGLLRAGGEHE